jgi:hypothetical protein
MLGVIISFAVGLALGSLPVLGAAWKFGSINRAARAIFFALFLVVPPLILTAIRIGPTKTLGNLGEFTVYGLLGSLIPLGQFLRVPRLRIPGEVIVFAFVFIVEACVYMWIPTLPETSLGLVSSLHN